MIELRRVLRGPSRVFGSGAATFLPELPSISEGLSLNASESFNRATVRPLQGWCGMHGPPRLASFAPLFAWVLLGGCLWAENAGDEPPEEYDEAMVSAPRVYGSNRDGRPPARRLPAIATGGRMRLQVTTPAIDPRRPSFVATTGGLFTATREGVYVTVKSQLAGDDVLDIRIPDQDKDRVYGSFPLHAAPIASLRLLFPEDRQTVLFHNPPPPRPLAVLAGGAPARFVVALDSASGERLLDQAMTVRVPDNAVAAQVHWDVIELRVLSSPPGAAPLALTVTAGGAPRLLALPVVPSIERLEAAPLSRPLVVGQSAFLCFEAVTEVLTDALAETRAVQGVTWTFAAQHLALSPAEAAGCVAVTASQTGEASLTASAGGLSHTLTMTVGAP
jgi:hypothetical protein